jgi:cytochrome c-type biogenesis protein CcmH/NrfG
MIGMCYLSTPSKHKALSYLLSASSQDETSFVVNYYLGRAYQIENRFEEAIAAYNAYLKSLEVAGIKFKEEKASNEANKLHVEKTPEIVNSLISQCVAMKTGNNNSVGINY